MFVTDVWDDIRELTSGYFAGDEALRDADGNRLHKQQAPIQLLLRIILSSTNPDDMVLDPFAGSGTTLVVAAQLGRKSVGIELDSHNVTLEPFVSAYERLLGSEYDALIVLTDYQKRKLHPPLRLQVIQWHCFLNTELADFALTVIARKPRDWLIVQSEAWTQKIFDFSRTSIRAIGGHHAYSALLIIWKMKSKYKD